MMTISMTRQWWETLQKGAYIGRAGSHEVWQHEMDVHPVWDNLSQIPSLSDIGDQLGFHWHGRRFWWHGSLVLNWHGTLVASCEQLAHLSPGPWCLSAPWGTQMKRQYNDNPKTMQRQYKDNAKTRHRRIPHTCQLALGCAYPCWDPGGQVSERAAGILSRLARFWWTVNCEL